MSDKESTYEAAAREIAALLEGESDEIARMATIASVLKRRLEHFYWVGFYRVDRRRPRELVVGPYQGTPGCLRIAFERGVCGACATRRETILVPDVHAFPGHIACDERSLSEIVVPVFDARGELIAVLDADSDRPAAFDATDRQWLERIVREQFATA